jgi:hypothetical protein
VSDSLVPLCFCAHLLDAQAIRASCEALGIPTLIDGEHQRGVLGMFGATAELRIMVPRSKLRLAYELAAEIIPDIPTPEFDDDEAEQRLPEPSPLRRALPEDLVPYPDDPDQQDADDPEDEDDDPRSIRALARAAASLGTGEVDEEVDDLAEIHPPQSLFAPRIGFAGGIILAGIVVAAGYLSYGLILAAIMAGLAYVRVLPIVEE